MKQNVRPALIVHGGATTIPKTETQAYKNGCFKAVSAGWDVLNRGGTAMDAVEVAVRALEADETYNAGYGSVLNRVGEVEMDAAIMDGATLNAGAVGAIQGVRHPVSVARLLLNEETVFLTGPGARCFAESQGAELCEARSMISAKQQQKWIQSQKWTTDNKAKSDAAGCDTVGCVALDAHGNLAAATSTGGISKKPPGRVGDSPLIGSGLYADDELGACSFTGDGDKILRLVMAKTSLDLLRDNLLPDEAAQRALQIMSRRVGGQAGCILIDPAGHIGWGHNSPHMACGYMMDGMEKPLVFVGKGEENQRNNLASYGTEE